MLPQLAVVLSGRTDATETAAVVGRTAGALAAVKNSSTLSVCSATQTRALVPRLGFG